jgi:hypothetical protein
MTKDNSFPIQTDLTLIAAEAESKFSENEDFREYLRTYPHDIDPIVHEINAVIEKNVDCTKCGNCCKTLMINVTAEEAFNLAKMLNQPLSRVRKQYLEESFGKQLIINTMPCHFLAENKCTIYADRFADCRAFPHLDRPGFKQRVFGTLMHYGRCPIIYNVVEELKMQTKFVKALNA